MSELGEVAPVRGGREHVRAEPVARGPDEGEAGVGKGALPGVAGRVLIDRDQGGHALPAGIRAAHEVPGAVQPTARRRRRRREPEPDLGETAAYELPRGE